MGALATALLTAGPSLIRAIGGLIGGDSKDVADKAADIVAAAGGDQSTVEQQLSQLSADQINALNAVQLKLLDIEHDRAKYAAQNLSDINQTMQTELQSGSGYQTNWRATTGWVINIGFIVMIGILGYSVYRDPANASSAMAAFMVMLPSMCTLVGVRISNERKDRQSQRGQSVSDLIDMVTKRERG